ncbi:MAG: MFS transporter [Gemmatimonadetes bacterium]|nr:MFS transporter [Gemmatimonadota bacterium]
MTAEHDPYSGIRNPLVRAYAFGRAASVLGNQVISTAVGWDLYERTHDAWALGLVGAIELAPVIVLMFVAGNAADRYPRRNILMAAHALLTLVGLGLLVASRLGGGVELVYGCLFFIGVARAFSAPAGGTVLPQLVSAEQLANANAWMSSSYEIAAISGPAVAGFLIAATGTATWAYLLGALGQLAFVVALTRLPALRPPPATGPHDARELFAGVAFIRRNPIYLAAITLDLFAVLLGGAVALLPIFAKDILHAGPTGLGYLRAAPAVGALLTALLVTRLKPWTHPGRVLLAVVVGFGLATVGFGLSRSFWLSFGCLFLTGAFDAISVVIRATIEQVITPDALRGRVSAVNFLFVGFSNELGSFESGSTAALVGPVASVVAGGIGAVLVTAVVAVAWPELAKIGPLHTLRPSDARLAEEDAVHASAETGP